MTIVKIDFTSYENMKFGRWVSWVSSNENAYQHFAGITETTLQNFHEYDLQIIFEWLNGLKNEPNIKPEAISILKKSYAQKIDAVTLCQRFEKEKQIVKVLPYLCAIFEQDAKDYNRKIDKIKEAWDAKSFLEGYKKGMGYLLGIAEYEKYMANNLKPIPYTDAQKKAGINEFERFGELNTYHSLAGKDITKHDLILKTSLEKVSIAIQYANLEAWYQKNMSDNHIAEMRAKSLKK
jgi:hypothetical protein